MGKLGRTSSAPKSFASGLPGLTSGGVPQGGCACARDFSALPVLSGGSCACQTRRKGALEPGPKQPPAASELKWTPEAAVGRTGPVRQFAGNAPGAPRGAGAGARLENRGRIHSRRHGRAVQLAESPRRRGHDRRSPVGARGWDRDGVAAAPGPLRPCRTAHFLKRPPPCERCTGMGGELNQESPPRLAPGGRVGSYAVATSLLLAWRWLVVWGRSG